MIQPPLVEASGIGAGKSRESEFPPTDRGGGCFSEESTH